MHGKREEVSKALDLHPNSISRKLSGKQGITLDEINRMADVLQMDATEFLILQDTEIQWKVVRIA